MSNFSFLELDVTLQACSDVLDCRIYSVFQSDYFSLTISNTINSYHVLLPTDVKLATSVAYPLSVNVNLETEPLLYVHTG